MSKALGAGCGGDAKKVTPAGAPAAGAYQLVLEPRGSAWRAWFVKIKGNDWRGTCTHRRAPV
jgi:hypothetical protein